MTHSSSEHSPTQPLVSAVGRHNREAPVVEQSSSALLERDARALAETSKLRFYPMVASSARGCAISDVEGRSYLDFGSGWCVANTGYGHPAVVKAISETAERLSFACLLTISHQWGIRLAEKLLEICPGDREPRKVNFGVSGSDAVDAVVKLVPAARRRPRLITFMYGAHGMSSAAGAVSSLPLLASFGSAGNAVRVPYPYAYRCPFGEGCSDCAAECVRFIEEHVFATLSPPELTAAILLEPVQSDGGVIVPPPTFLPRLRDLCKKYDILLVDDEVKTGCGRSGRMLAAHVWGVNPDVVLLGKSLGAGLPLSALIGPASVLDAFPISHAFTTAGNPVCCAAALAGLEVLEQEDLADNAARMGERLIARLREIQTRYELIGDVRGLGLMVGVELVQDRQRKTPAKLETAKVVYRAWELGLVLGYVGVHSNVLEITPPLTISAAEIDRGVDRLEEAIRDVSEGKVADEAVAAFAGW